MAVPYTTIGSLAPSGTARCLPVYRNQSKTHMHCFTPSCGRQLHDWVPLHAFLILTKIKRQIWTYIQVNYWAIIVNIQDGDNSEYWWHNAASKLNKLNKKGYNKWDNRSWYTLRRIPDTYEDKSNTTPSQLLLCRRKTSNIRETILLLQKPKRKSLCLHRNPVRWPEVNWDWLT